MDLLSSDFVVPLEVSPTLDRIVAMLANMDDNVKAHGRYVYFFNPDQGSGFDNETGKH